MLNSLVLIEKLAYIYISQSSFYFTFIIKNNLNVKYSPPKIPKPREVTPKIDRHTNKLMVPISDLQWCEQPYRDHPFVYVSLNLSGLALVAFLVSLKVFQKFRGGRAFKRPFSSVESN